MFATDGGFARQIFRDQGKALQAMTSIIKDEKFDVKTIQDGFAKVL